MKPQIEHIIDICENGIAFDGVLVIAAIIEFIDFVQSAETERLVLKLSELQKRLKYGLPTMTAVGIYELGFADRVVSQDVSIIAGEVNLEKHSIVQNLKSNQKRVKEILDKYPSYFIERLNNLG